MFHIIHTQPLVDTHFWCNKTRSDRHQPTAIQTWYHSARRKSSTLVDRFGTRIYARKAGSDRHLLTVQTRLKWNWRPAPIGAGRLRRDFIDSFLLFLSPSKSKRQRACGTPVRLRLTVEERLQFFRVQERGNAAEVATLARSYWEDVRCVVKKWNIAICAISHANQTANILIYISRYRQQNG